MQREPRDNEALAAKGGRVVTSSASHSAPPSASDPADTSTVSASQTSHAPRTSRMAILIDADNAFACLSGPTLTRMCEYLERFGHVQSLRAYGDWERLGKALTGSSRYHLQPVHLPTGGKRRKNGVDIALAVDAIDDLHLAPEIDTFVLVTGDGDLAPVALRLRERGRRVIGLGRQQSTSEFLVKACDIYIYLESLGIGVDQASPTSPLATEVYDALRNPESNNGHTHEFAGGNGSSTESHIRTAAHGDINRVAHENGRTHTEVPAQYVLPLDLREAFTAALANLQSAGSREINAGTLKQALLKVHSTFNEKRFGVKRFSDFLTKYAHELGVVVEQARGNEVLITPLGDAGSNLRSTPALPRIEGFTLLAMQSFTCGGQGHTLPVYRHERIAAALDIPVTRRDPAVEFVLLPGGTYQVGYEPPPGTCDVATPAQVGRPLRKVTLAPFLMGRTPVTQGVWDQMRTKKRIKRISDKRHFTRMRGGHRRLPMEGVSWNDARAFLGSLGLRLPSEAEWELACRGGVANEVPYFWGSEESEAERFAWSKENSAGCLHAVASAPAGPNAYGLFDMAGNVWEWCADAWHPDYEGLPSDGAPRVASGEGPPLYVVRGGSFHYPLAACRCDFRWRLAPEVRHYTVGFRPVMSVSR